MKTVLLYALLVGAPVIGVLGVLRAGAGLEAPLSVGGVWRFDVARVATDGCIERALPAHEPLLTLVQSGPRIRAQGPATHARGGIEGRVLTLRGDGGAWTLRAELAVADELALVGTWTCAGCGRHEALSVHAKRESTPHAEEH